MTAALEDLLVAVTAAGLPGSLLELPRDPLPESEALELVRATERLGIAGFLLAAVRDSRLGLPAPAMDVLARAQLRESTTRVYLEQELLSVTGLLDDAGLESRVLGGSAVANLDYRDPQLRSVTGLDLLVHPPEAGRAAEVLRRHGWRPPKRPDHAAGPGIRLVGPSGPPLSLHTGLDSAPPGLIVDQQQLWSDGDQFSVSGRKLKALGTEQRLLYTSSTAGEGDAVPSLVPLRDLLEIVLFGEWRQARLMAMTAAWNAQGMLSRAVRSAWRRLAIADVTGLSVWAEHHPADSVRPGGRGTVAGAATGRPARPWSGLRGRLARHS